MTSLGDLSFRMLADLAQLRADMGSAKDIVGKTADGMSSAFGTVKTALAAVGVGLSAGAFAVWIKSSIDAADSMKSFSQQTGVAVKDVAGLQLAFKQGGIESDALGSALSKMTRGMATGADAFKTLGVATHNADGTMRGAKDVLYDTADAIASVKGESERVALAIEVFGKSGAQLLPVFADGADGLREMADMADKLGLSLDGDAAEAADKFNDTLELLGLSTQGVGRQVAAQLLPALNGIVGAFLNFITEGDRVRKMAEFIGTGLKGLYSAGVAIVQVFSSVGKTVGVVMAQIVAIMNGDFKGALAVGREWVDDMKTDWTATIKNVGDAWEGASADTTKALATVTRSMRDVKIATDAQKESQKQASKDQKEAAREFERAQKEKEKLIKDEMDLQSRRALAAIASYEREQQAVDDSVAKAGEMVQAIQRETEALTMSNTEREISNALLALEKTGLEQGTYAYEVYADKIRAAVVNREAVAQSIEQSKQIADNWNELTKQIGQGLTDSLFRAFESGKGFFNTLWEGIKNTFKTTVLRLAINAVMNPINAAIGGLLGGLPGFANAGGAAGAGAGAGGLGGFGGLSSLGSLFGGLGGLGGLAGAGFGMTMSGGLGGALGAAGAAMGNGAMMGGLAIGAGALAPIALGAGLLYNVFKRERTPHTGGATSATAGGASSASWGQVTGLFNRNFDRDSGTDAALGATSQGLAAALQVLSDLSGGGAISVNSAFADDSSKDPSWGAFRLLQGSTALANWKGTREFADGQAGMNQFMASMAADALKAAQGMKLPDWAKEVIDALPSTASLQDIAAAAEKIKMLKDERDAPKTTEEQISEPAAEVALEAIRTEVRDMRTQLAEVLEKMRAGSEAALTAVASATAATQRVLEGWSDGDAIATRAAD